jgi:hypothetical protein
MKRREWLKGLFCAPLALVPVQAELPAAENVNIRVEGTLIHESQLADVVVRALNQAQRRGLVSPSVFTGNLSLLK